MHSSRMHTRRGGGSAYCPLIHYMGGSLLTPPPFNQKAITEGTTPEGLTRRPYQKAITEDHTRRPYQKTTFNQKTIPEGCLQSEGHQTRRPYQDATPEGHNRRPLGADPPDQAPLLGAGPLGAGTPLETCCKACWDSTCNACWDNTPPGDLLQGMLG